MNYGKVGGGLSGQADSLSFWHLGVEQHSEHGREIALEAFPAPGQQGEEPILRARREAVNPPVQARPANVSRAQQPQHGNDAYLNGRENPAPSKHRPGERGQGRPLQYAREDFGELGEDLEPEDNGHRYHRRRDGERDENEIVERAAHLGDAVAQQQPAGGQDLADVADAFADVEHGADLRGQQAGHQHQRLAQAAPPVRCARPAGGTGPPATGRGWRRRSGQRLPVSGLPARPVRSNPGASARARCAAGAE